LKKKLHRYVTKILYILPWRRELEDMLDSINTPEEKEIQRLNKDVEEEARQWTKWVQKKREEMIEEDIYARQYAKQWNELHL